VWGCLVLALSFVKVTTLVALVAHACPCVDVELMTSDLYHSRIHSMVICLP